MRGIVTMLTACTVLAAVGCSGGGSAPSSVQPTPPLLAPPSLPMPVGNPPTIPATTPSATSANATGRVVDLDSGAGLGGFTVALAPATSATTPQAVALTAAAGTFAFSVAPGRYLIVIGTNAPGDAHTTVHELVTLRAGPNALALGTPEPEPQVIYSVAQRSGAYRLAALSPIEVNCLIATNEGRAALSLPPVVADEVLLELARRLVAEELAQRTEAPVPLGTANVPAFDRLPATGTTSENFPDCGAWTGPSYSYRSGNPPYAQATNRVNVLYGASFSNGSGGTSYGAQFWRNDPRAYP